MTPGSLSVMDLNWEGREDLRQVCVRAPKYGNDDDDADRIACEVHLRTEQIMETVKDRFGFSMRGDGSAVSATYGLASNTPATPDGRRHGEDHQEIKDIPAKFLKNAQQQAIVCGFRKFVS